MPTKRKADCTPEEYALIRQRANEAQKRYDKTDKGRERSRRKSRAKWARKGDEIKVKQREYQRRMRLEKPEQCRVKALRKKQKNPEAAKRRERRRYWRNAPPRRAKELMLKLYQMVPQISSRDEIVAEAAMLVMEGVKIEDAVNLSRRKTISDEYRQKYTKQLDDCFWL